MNVDRCHDEVAVRRGGVDDAVDVGILVLPNVVDRFQRVGLEIRANRLAGPDLERTRRILIDNARLDRRIDRRTSTAGCWIVLDAVFGIRLFEAVEQGVQRLFLSSGSPPVDDLEITLGIRITRVVGVVCSVSCIDLVRIFVLCTPCERSADPPAS